MGGYDEYFFDNCGPIYIFNDHNKNKNTAVK